MKWSICFFIGQYVVYYHYWPNWSNRPNRPNWSNRFNWFNRSSCSFIFCICSTFLALNLSLTVCKCWTSVCNLWISASNLWTFVSKLSDSGAAAPTGCGGAVGAAVAAVAAGVIEAARELTGCAGCSACNFFLTSPHQDCRSHQLWSINFWSLLYVYAVWKCACEPDWSPSWSFICSGIFKNGFHFKISINILKLCDANFQNMVSLFAFYVLFVSVYYFSPFKYIILIYYYNNYILFIRS